jgi:hypothetical protein
MNSHFLAQLTLFAGLICGIAAAQGAPVADSAARQVAAPQVAAPQVAAPQVGDTVEVSMGRRREPGIVVFVSDDGKQADVDTFARGRVIQYRLWMTDLKKIDQATYDAMRAAVLDERKPRSSKSSGAAASPSSPLLELPSVMSMPPGPTLQLPATSPRRPLPTVSKTVHASIPEQATIELPAASLNADRSVPLLIDGPRGRVVFTVAQKRDDVFNSAVVLADLATGKTIELGHWDAQRLRLIAANLRRGVVLALSDLQPDAVNASLTVITGLAGVNPKTTMRWSLPVRQEGLRSPVRNASVASDGIVVVQLTDQVIAWDLTRKRELWRFDNAGGAVAAFTADERFIAMQQESQIVVVEIATGTLFGRLDLDNAFPAGLAFTPDGQRLAVGHHDRVRVFDMRDWSQLNEFTLPEAPPHAYGGSAWFDDQHLLLTGGILIRPDQHLVAWHYQGNQWERQTFGQAAFGFFGTFFRSGHVATLVALKLPHRSVPQFDAGETRNDLALRRGQTVRLDANVGDSPMKSEVLRSAGEQFLRRIGWVPGDSGQATLKIRMTRAKPRQVEYQRIAGPGPSQSTWTFTPWTVSLQLVRGTQILWQFSSTPTAPSLTMGELAEKLRQAELPDLKFMQRVRLLPEIVSPEFAGGYGASRITAQGLERVPR